MGLSVLGDVASHRLNFKQAPPVIGDGVIGPMLPMRAGVGGKHTMFNCTGLRIASQVRPNLHGGYDLYHTGAPGRQVQTHIAALDLSRQSALQKLPAWVTPGRRGAPLMVSFQ